MSELSIISEHFIYSPTAKVISSICSTGIKYGEGNLNLSFSFGLARAFDKTHSFIREQEKNEIYDRPGNIFLTD